MITEKIVLPIFSNLYSNTHHYVFQKKIFKNANVLKILYHTMNVVVRKGRAVNSVHDGKGKTMSFVELIQKEHRME